MSNLLSLAMVLAIGGPGDEVPGKPGRVAPKQEQPPQDLDEAERALREAEEAMRRRREREAKAARPPGAPSSPEVEALIKAELKAAEEALERAARAESSRAPSAPPEAQPKLATPAAPPSYSTPDVEAARLKESRAAAEAQMRALIAAENARVAAELGAKYSDLHRPVDLPMEAAAAMPPREYALQPLFTPPANAYVPVYAMSPGYIGTDVSPEQRIGHMCAVHGRLEAEAATRMQKAPNATYEERWGDAALNVRRALRP